MNLSVILWMPYTLIESILNQMGNKGRQTFTVLITALLVLIYFSRLILSPSEYMLAYYGDELKNYYNLLQFVRTCSSPLIHYSGMNYPFGEIVYYTDNTPILSIPLKWIHCNWGVLISPITVFNILVVSNFIAGSLLLYKLLSRLLKSNTLIIALSIALPFLNPQAVRIISGTENLSFSIFIIAAVYLSWKIFDDAREHQTNYRLLFFIPLLLGATAFTHFYLFVMVTGYLLLHLTLLAIVSSLKPYKTLNHLISIFITALSFLLIYYLIRLSDPHFDGRNTTALGYDLINWKISINSLLSPHLFLKFNPNIVTQKLFDVDGQMYIGSFAILGTALLSILFLLRSKFSANNHSNIWICSLLVTGAFWLSISMGRFVYLNDEPLFYNYLNPFNLIENDFPFIHHFRALGRFGWIFFWSITIAVAFCIDRYVQGKSNMAIVGLYVLLPISIWDMTGVGETYRYQIKPNVLNEKYASEDARELAIELKKHTATALMPLPFFQVGSEKIELTLDPTYDYVVTMEMVCAVRNIPMMSSMMSRTPIHFSQSMFNFYKTGYDSLLLSQLKGQRILVTRSFKEYELRKNWLPIESHEADVAFSNAMSLPEQLHMQLVSKINDYEIFIWQP